MRTPAAQRKLFGRLALRYPRAIRDWLRVFEVPVPIPGPSRPVVGPGEGTVSGAPVGV
jgi:hypothetical protein